MAGWQSCCHPQVHNTPPVALISPAACLSTAPGVDQATLRLKQLPEGTSIDRGTGFGRLAYSCPDADLAPLQVRS